MSYSLQYINDRSTYDCIATNYALQCFTVMCFFSSLSENCISTDNGSRKVGVVIKLTQYNYVCVVLSSLLKKIHLYTSGMLPVMTMGGGGAILYTKWLLLSTHSLNPCYGRSPIFPLVVNQPATRPSGQQCSQSGGPVHKSRGDSVVRMLVQLKSLLVL